MSDNTVWKAHVLTNNEVTMRLTMKLLLGLLLTCFLLPAFAEKYVDDESGETKTKIYHIYKDIDLIPSSKIDYAKPRIVFKAVYPLLAGNDDEKITAFNDEVNRIIKEEFNDFKKQAADLQTFQEHLPKEKIKNTLNIDFSTAVINKEDKPIISVRFAVEGYLTGMAHPFHHHRVLNYDLANGEVMDLSDLFNADTDYLAVMADISRQKLIKKFGDTQMVTDGTAAKAENYKVWNIYPRGLLITFDEGQVAPYVHGSQTVLIPYDKLKNDIDPNSPIGICIKKSKKCINNNLLTGGFIDQALNSKHGTFDPILS